MSQSRSKLWTRRIRTLRCREYLEALRDTGKKRRISIGKSYRWVELGGRVHQQQGPQSLAINVVSLTSGVSHSSIKVPVHRDKDSMTA